VIRWQAMAGSGRSIFHPTKGCQISRLEQPFPRMVLEDFSVAHVSAQRVHARMPTASAWVRRLVTACALCPQ
jgi:hypothetical protein